MRLVNLDRRGNGLAALFSDPKLVNLARDLTWTCPTKSSLVIHGRARKVCDASSRVGLTPSTTPINKRKAVGVNDRSCARRIPCSP